MKITENSQRENCFNYVNSNALNNQMDHTHRSTKSEYAVPTLTCDLN